MKREDLPPNAGEELHHLCFGRTDLKTSRRTEGSQGIDKPLQLEGAIRKESEVVRVDQSGQQARSAALGLNTDTGRRHPVTKPALQCIDENSKKSGAERASLLYTAQHRRTFPNAAINVDNDVSITVQSLNSCKHLPRHAAGTKPLPQQ